jgi:hypothetical protein
LPPWGILADEVAVPGNKSGKSKSNIPEQNITPTVIDIGIAK